MSNAISICKYWEIKTVNGATGEIGLRSDLPWYLRMYVKWIHHIEVVSMYSDVEDWLSSPVGMAYDEAMWHGNFSATDEVKKKIHTVIQLKPGWSIRDDSISALIHGPLLNADGSVILVHAHGSLTRFVLWLEAMPIIRLTLILAGILGLLLTLL